jgi:ketosteroid isomerase-like protein
MKKFPFLMAAFLVSCSPKDSVEKSKAEVIQAEKDFAAMAREKGIAQAFYAFAADDAAIKRGPNVIKGKQAIKEFYDSQTQTGELQWSPDFADVSGDLGYTYGKFTFSEKDSTGKVNETQGIFHTVWKKQKDGSWKFVWD